MFRAYIEEVQSPRQVVDALGAARLRWDQFIDQQNAVSIALLEDDGANAVPSQSVAGRILSLEIRRQKAGLAIQIENALDVDGSEMLSQLRIAQQVASSFLRERLHAEMLPNHRFRIPHTAPIMGKSLTFAAAMGMVCFASQEWNRRIRWDINPRTLCIGNIREDGTLEESPLPVLQNKIHLAFFSPVKRVVVHTQQCDRATRETRRLRDMYPNRTLEVIGVSSLAECFDRQGIVDVQLRSSFDRVKHVARRHALAITVFCALLFLLIAGYAVYSARYAHPNLEHALGIRIGNNAVVFNPKDTLEWCFRDGLEVKEPIIPFGDMEVGDGFTRTFWVWNMTPRRKNVEMVLEGRDASEWYLNWNGGTRELPAAAQEGFSVMFAPRTRGMSKTEDLVLRDPGSKKDFFRLRLTGSAGAPLAGGYALRFDGEDDMIFFGKNAPTFASEVGIFECWVRPLEVRDQAILYNGSNYAEEPDFQNMLIRLVRADTLSILLGNFRGTIPLKGGDRIRAGVWTHIAVAYSIPEENIAVFLNGVPVLKRTTRFFIEGLLCPHVTIGCRYDGRLVEAPFKGDIDEIRFWRTFRTGEQIRCDMHRVISGTTPGLYGYWNFDTDHEVTAFTGTDRSENGVFWHRPALVRSDIPSFDGTL